MAIHVKSWEGSGTATVTEMENAGRRGKTCRVFRFSGWNPVSYCSPEAEVAGRATWEVIRYLLKLDAKSSSFDEVLARVKEILAQYESRHLNVYEEEIKGIHAPVETLTFGNEKWGMTVNEHGISVSDHTDHFNEPTMITMDQSCSRAYKLVQGVADQLAQAQTFYEAGEILRKAGCKLHFYCAID